MIRRTDKYSSAPPLEPTSLVGQDRRSGRVRVASASPQFADVFSLRESGPGGAGELQSQASVISEMRRNSPSLAPMRSDQSWLKSIRGNSRPRPGCGVFHRDGAVRQQRDRATTDFPAPQDSMMDLSHDFCDVEIGVDTQRSGLEPHRCVDDRTHFENVRNFESGACPVISDCKG
jgi:hypothetical protein